MDKIYVLETIGHLQILGTKPMPDYHGPFAWRDTRDNYGQLGFSTIIDTVNAWRNAYELGQQGLPSDVYKIEDTPKSDNVIYVDFKAKVVLKK